VTESVAAPGAELPPSAPDAARLQRELNTRGAGHLADYPQDEGAAYWRAIGSFPRMNRDDELRAGQRIAEGQREVVNAVIGSNLAAKLGVEPAAATPADVDRVVHHLGLLLHGLDQAGGDTERVAALEAQADMSRAELRALREAIQRGEKKAAAAKADLVQSHLRLVPWVARRYANRGVSLLDLVQEGNLGLMTAANKFDHTLGTRFGTYAIWWIRQAITRALADHGRTIRLPANTVQAVMRVARARRHLAQRVQRDPTALEIATELGEPVERVEEITAWARHVVSLDMPIGEDEDTTLGELIADPNTELPSAAIMASELATVTRETLAELTPREREVLSLRFGIDGDEVLTLEEIGNRFGVTRERIRQIEARALSKLRHPSRAQGLRPFAEH